MKSVRKQNWCLSAAKLMKDEDKKMMENTKKR